MARICDKWERTLPSLSPYTGSLEVRSITKLGSKADLAASAAPVGFVGEHDWQPRVQRTAKLHHKRFTG